MKPPSQHTVKWAIVKLREVASENQTDLQNLKPLLLAWDSGDKDEFFTLCRGVLPLYAKQSVFVEEILEYAQSLLGKVMIQHFPRPQNSLCYSPKFNNSFPERFEWERLDSISLSDLACELAGQVQVELGQPIGNRVNVPGLRFALLRIAGMVPTPESLL